LLVVALVITLSVNVPIDYAIDRWTVETLPADWMSIRNRWEALSRRSHVRQHGGIRIGTDGGACGHMKTFRSADDGDFPYSG
jgi:hypothetical protein